MGRKSTDSTAQAKAKTKPSGSTPSMAPKLAKTLTPTSGGTPGPKPASMGSRKPKAVESDKVEAGGHSEGSPAKRKKTTVPLTTTKKSVDDIPKPSTSKKDVQPKPKPVKSTLTTANPGGNSEPKSVRKGQKAVPEPVEADSEESEEWVGFGGADEEEDEEEGSCDSSEEDLLHGLSSDDDQDSSDEEVDLPGIDISKLPTIAKDDKIVKQKLEKAKRQTVCITSTITLLPFVV